jgi:hypothetical protein
MRQIESCNSLWLFDVDSARFCRLPRGADPSDGDTQGDWQPYFELDVDDDGGGFRVALDAGRTHWLSSYRHTDPCQYCGSEPTREMQVISPDEHAER